MKLAQEYKGYYMDVFYVDGLIYGLIRDKNIYIHGTTVQELVERFKSKVTNLEF